MKTGFAFMGLLGLLTMQSCTETLLERNVNEESVKVTIRIASFEQVPFTKAMSGQTKGVSGPMGICSKVNFAVYSYQDDILTKQQENQDVGSEGFGTASFNLEEGTYRIIVLAHSGDTNPTMTVPTKISFNNKNSQKVTDTFLYSADVNITKETHELDLDLKRVVAMFQLNLEDASLPEGVSQLRFDYSGGSSTIDAVSGLGCVASKQSETLACQPGVMEYGVYTFVRGDSDKLKIKVSALNSSGEVLKEQEFQDVPVTCNYITRYSGKMFNKEILASGFSVLIDDEWAGTVDCTF